jgi:DNA-binding transcriptional MocR family regulator
LKQVAADHGLDRLAFRLAFWLSQSINRKTGDAWPSIATLARLTGTTDRTVQRLIRQLCERGHLVMQPGGGRHKPNHYRFMAKTATDTSPFSGREQGAQASKPRPTGDPIYLTESTLNHSAKENQRRASARIEEDSDENDLATDLEAGWPTDSEGRRERLH